MLMSNLASRKFDTKGKKKIGNFEEDGEEDICESNEILTRTKISTFEGDGEEAERERRTVILEFDSSDMDDSSEEFDIKKDILVNERSMY